MKKRMALIMGTIALAAVAGVAQGATKLAVQDSTGTTDKFVVTDQGYIGVGNNAPTGAIQVVGTGVVQSQLLLQNTGLTTSSGGGGTVMYHNNAAGALPNNGDRLGYFFFGSMNGATPINAAGIAARADGAWTATSTPSSFAFETTTAGFATRGERMRITNAGNVGIGTTAPSQRLEINGGMRLNTAIVKQTCSSGVRGTFWLTQNATVGVADTLQVCAKKSDETYAWITVF